MEAYRCVYDSRRVQADCQEPGSAPVIEYGLPFLMPELRLQIWPLLTSLTVVSKYVANQDSWNISKPVMVLDLLHACDLFIIFYQKLINSLCPFNNLYSSTTYCTQQTDRQNTANKYN